MNHRAQTPFRVGETVLQYIVSYLRKKDNLARRTNEVQRLLTPTEAHEAKD